MFLDGSVTVEQQSGTTGAKFVSRPFCSCYTIATRYSVNRVMRPEQASPKKLEGIAVTTVMLPEDDAAVCGTGVVLLMGGIEGQE